MTVTIYLTLAIAIVGLLLWAVCSGATVKAALAELGKAMLWSGLFAFCFALATKVIHL